MLACTNIYIITHCKKSKYESTPREKDFDKLGKQGILESVFNHGIRFSSSNFEN